MYLDLNNNGLLESGEPSAVTLADATNTDDINEDGLYLFTSLAAGDYTVADLEDPVGGTQSVPLEMGYTPHTLAASDGPSGVTTIDANADGLAALVATNRASNTVSVFTATTGGDYLDPVEYEVGVGPASVVTADLDADGNDDLVVATRYPGHLSLLHGDARGAFDEAVNS